MSSRRTSLVRTITVGCAVAGAVAAGAGPANALPVRQPAFIHHDFHMGTFAGTPIPIGYAVVEVDAATNGTGVVRFTVGRRCASEGGRPCGYTVDMSVRWINFANGATGTTTIGGNAKFITTGRGPVGLSFAVLRGLNSPTVGLVNS